ncbi:cytochrome b-c1 complex subunit 7 [Dioszegia hungarica]|uniref:Cytochrome b-c1 complex subunit 7 n=1 Tax=Dioszegia hungarica TaxID=4972 RepID=A0AA38LV34_9TREE|nr:cytochrome b-c1 complex subunit 7 [Dioszegia hungarica]KAI9636765.1 cytochrome b-c1 complex subunit 7 [Dioszegia hungarica]
MYKSLKPLANAYAHITGYRQHGLRYDDLIIEEREDVQKALTRLPQRESYDRVFRMKQAFQQSVLHRELPKDQWLKPEDDTRYLAPIIEQVAKEDSERAEWDSLVVEKKK